MGLATVCLLAAHGAAVAAPGPEPASACEPVENARTALGIRADVTDDDARPGGH